MRGSHSYLLLSILFAAFAACSGAGVGGGGGGGSENCGVGDTCVTFGAASDEKGLDMRGATLNISGRTFEIALNTNGYYAAGKVDCVTPQTVTVKTPEGATYSFPNVQMLCGGGNSYLFTRQALMANDDRTFLGSPPVLLNYRIITKAQPILMKIMLP